MKKNMGVTDRALRLMLALVFVYLGFVLSPYFFFVTFLLIFTVITSYCPAYSLIKFNTIKLN